MICKSKRRSGPGVDGQKGAEIHWVDVLGGSSHDCLYDDPVGPFRWMKWIPKRINVSVRAQVGCRRA